MKTRAAIRLIFGLLIVLPSGAAHQARGDLAAWQEKSAAGKAALDAGKDAEAEKLYTAALRVAEGLGPGHPALINALNDMARVYSAQGKYQQAEPFCVRAVGIQEQAVGPNNLLTLASVSQLARVYRGEGKFDLAEPLFNRVLTIHRAGPPATALDVAETTEDLGVMYFLQGKIAEAQAAFEQTLSAREKLMAAGAPEIGRTLTNLAVLYTRQGDFPRPFTKPIPFPSHA